MSAAVKRLLRRWSRPRDGWLVRGDRAARALGGGRGAAGAARRRLADLRLAVRADLPARIERAAAGAAGLLQAAQAARAAQERLLDLEVAVRAGHLLDLLQPRRRRRDLELAFAHVVEVLGRAHDHVDDRADEGEEERRGGGATDQHRVLDAAPGVGEG